MKYFWTMIIALGILLGLIQGFSAHAEMLWPEDAKVASGDVPTMGDGYLAGPTEDFTILHIHWEASQLTGTPNGIQFYCDGDPDRGTGQNVYINVGQYDLSGVKEKWSGDLDINQECNTSYNMINTSGADVSYVITYLPRWRSNTELIQTSGSFEPKNQQDDYYHGLLLTLGITCAILWFFKSKKKGGEYE